MSPIKAAISVGSLIVLLILFLFLKPFTIIGAGARGVVLHWGAFQGQVMQPGLNWKTPLSQTVISMDVQTQKEEIDVSAASKDLQTVTAEQEALKAKNNLEQVKFEAQQQIETAKAQAESIKIQAQAINAQGGADYVKLKAIEKWDGKVPQQMIPNASIPFINLNQ